MDQVEVLDVQMMEHSSASSTADGNAVTHTQTQIQSNDCNQKDTDPFSSTFSDCANSDIQNVFNSIQSTGKINQNTEQSNDCNLSPTCTNRGQETVNIHSPSSSTISDKVVEADAKQELQQGNTCEGVIVECINDGVSIIDVSVADQATVDADAQAADVAKQ